MNKILTVKDRVRVDPKLLGEKIEQSVIDAIREDYVNKLFPEGVVLDLVNIDEIGEGHIIPGDGAVFYETIFKLLVWKPELHEIVEGKIREITDFGCFVNIGPIDGMMHVSQVMDDFVSVSNSGNLQGRDSGKTLKVGDMVRARIVAISMRNLESAKVGLTMRQEGLGKLEWIYSEKKENKKGEKKE